MNLPPALYVMPARFDTSCPVCGTMVLQGERIAGPMPAGTWVHETCVRGLYRALGQTAPRLREHTRSDSTARHDVVNRADAAPCSVCGRRFILGRDGAPIDSPQGARHNVCPPGRPALPCGHRATYKGGPNKGLCRACTRQGVKA
jgi:DNA-directed RNA polymerase subunit RPC12/RpoP